MKFEITAKRLRKALSNSNMSAQELAEKSNVSKASISQYINGYHQPSNISSQKIGEVLGVNPLWLMGFDVDMDIEWNPKTQEIEVDDEGNIANTNRELEVFISYLRRNEDFANRMMEYASFLLSKDKKKPEATLNKLLEEHFEE